MKRRILSSLMALVLVFGLLPVSAMAEAGNHDPLTKSSAIQRNNNDWNVSDSIYD